MVSFVALTAEATPADRQYEPSDDSEASGSTPESSAPSDSTSETGFVSQGSSGTEDTPEARAARADFAEEERLPDYSQAVDNSTKGRFVAPGWRHVSGDDSSHGADYAVARAGSNAKKATFRVKVPTNNDYAVYAWWPAAKNNASAARFAIETASGIRSERVNETRDGGMWIKLGAFEMKKGERTIRVVPSGDANVVADAVAIVRGGQTPIYEEATGSAEGGDTFRAAATSTATGADIVRSARRFLGTRYRYATCTTTLMSCTCETKRAVAPFGHRFPMTENGQWNYEPSRKFRSASYLRPGDIVFFREGGGAITHVGVYSGRGYLVHASSYFGKVVESKIRYIRGYTGAIRVNPR